MAIMVVYLSRYNSFTECFTSLFKAQNTDYCVNNQCFYDGYVEGEVSFTNQKLWYLLLLIYPLILWF